jgi:magnesium chelatase family protein
MVGPPGTGKSMLAARLPGLLPALEEGEALEVAAIHSLAGRFSPAQWARRPFRHPHHSASAAAIVGGGSVPRPGEISLAHCGVLFLDELAEFERRVLEALREPLEGGSVQIARAGRQAQFPARFQLVAAMNPCPCGYLGHASGRCRCTSEQIARYRARLSGPLLDRIDLHVQVPALPLARLRDGPGEPSAAVRSRVAQARLRQTARQGKLNAALAGPELERFCGTEHEAERLLVRAVERLSLSARTCHRLLRVARTIADLDATASIAGRHMGEALQHRDAAG